MGSSFKNLISDVESALTADNSTSNSLASLVSTGLMEMNKIFLHGIIQAFAEDPRLSDNERQMLLASKFYTIRRCFKAEITKGMDVTKAEKEVAPPYELNPHRDTVVVVCKWLNLLPVAEKIWENAIARRDREHGGKGSHESG